MIRNEYTRYENLHPARGFFDIQIEGAPKAPGQWLLWSYGRIRQCGNTPSLAFEVYAQFVRLNQWGSYGTSSDRHSGWVDIVAMSIAPTGTIFISAKPVGFWKKLSLETLYCYDDEKELIGQTGSGNYLKVDRKFDTDTVRTFSSCIGFGESDTDRFNRVVIQSTELLRFYLTSSSNMAYSMFFHPSVFPSGFELYYQDTTKALSEDTFQIAPRPSFESIGHITSLATILMCPDLTNLWQQVSAAYFYDSVTQRPSGSSQRSTIARCEWPSELTKFVALGRIQKSRDTRVGASRQATQTNEFQVYAIVSDQRRFKYSNLHILREGSEGIGGETTWKDPTFSTKRERGPGSPNELKTGGGGSSRQPSRNIHTDDFLAKFQNFAAIDLSQRISTDRKPSRERTGSEPRPLESYQSGHGGGNSNSQQLNVYPKVRPPVGPGSANDKDVSSPALPLFTGKPIDVLPSELFSVEALEAPISKTLTACLNLKHGALNAVGSTSLSSGNIELINMHPDWGARASRTRKRLPRRAFCGEVFADGRYFYIFDLEAKGGVLSQICVFAKGGYSRISHEEKCVVLKTWTAATKDKVTSNSLWPNHNDFHDVVSYGLDHSAPRKADAMLVRDAIDLASSELFRRYP